MTLNYYMYYEEIKNRFTLIALCWGFCFGICYLYKETLLFLIVESNNNLNKSKQAIYFIFTNVTEVFNVYLDLIFFISNQVTIIIFLYQSLMFLSLGLYRFEFVRLKLAFQLFVLTWVASMILLYKIVVPISWAFFLSFQQSNNFNQQLSLFFETKLSEYFYYFTDLYYICLMNCQFLAVILLFLINLSEEPQKIKTFRKLFYLTFVIFSTIITPPDIISQIVISLIFILFYELLLFIKILKN